MTNDISSLEFVAFDTETTGLYPNSEALVEIAAVRFHLLHGPQEYFQTLVNPGKEIPWQATRVHGITDEMVFEAPKTGPVLQEFFRFIEGAIPVAHNSPFDLGFISLHALRNDLSLPDTPVLDSCMFSRRIQKEMASHSLENLVKELGIQENTFHRALADAKSCAELFRILVGKSCGVNASWEELVSAHGKILSFHDGGKKISDDIPLGHLEALIEALQSKRSIWIQYEGSYGARELTPLLLYTKGSQKYMEATCHLDGIRKSFRLDKIKKIVRPEEGADFS